MVASAFKRHGRCHLAFIIGIPVLRLSGYYLAVQPGIRKILRSICKAGHTDHWRAVRNPKHSAAQLFGLPLVGPYFSGLVALVFLLCALLIRNLTLSPLGARSRCSRQSYGSEETALTTRSEACGIVLAASLAGIAVLLQAFYACSRPALLGWVSPSCSCSWC